jgi:hypothetical protein
MDGPLPRPLGLGLPLIYLIPKFRHTSSLPLPRCSSFSFSFHLLYIYQFAFLSFPLCQLPLYPGPTLTVPDQLCLCRANSACPGLTLSPFFLLPSCCPASPSLIMYAAQNPLDDDSDFAYEVYDIDSEDEDSEDGDDGVVGKRLPMPYYPNDPESQKQRAKAAFNAYLGDPLDDSPIIMKETRVRRETIIELFRQYITVFPITVILSSIKLVAKRSCSGLLVFSRALKKK